MMKFSTKTIIFSSTIALQTATLAHHAMASQPGTVKNLRQQFESSSTQSNPQPASRAGGIGSLLSSTDIPALTAARDRYPVGSELYNRYDKRIKILEAQNKPKLDPKMQAKAQKVVTRTTQIVQDSDRRELAIKDDVKEEAQEPLIERNKALLKEDMSAHIALRDLYSKAAQGQAVTDAQIKEANQNIKEIEDKMATLELAINHFTNAPKIDAGYVPQLTELENREKEVAEMFKTLEEKGYNPKELENDKALHARVMNSIKDLMDQKKELNKRMDATALSMALGEITPSPEALNTLSTESENLLDKLKTRIKDEGRLFDTIQGNLEHLKETEELQAKQ